MGLARNQLVILAAKSATVRHLATHPKYKDLFVLKGGTLLSNVYRSPRQSIADADYTYLDRENLDLPKLEEALATDGSYGFDLRPEDGQWTTENELFEGKTPFSISGIQLGRRPADRELKISVSVRPGEWLDPGPPLVYSDQLLAEDDVFSVNGLTREELSAEKILGWCTKPLPKHLVDLAYVARDHAEELALDRTADLLGQKFREESGSPRYQGAGITRLPDLARVFLSEPKIEELRESWSTFAETELLLLPGELAKDDGATLSRVENIERFAADFWMPFLEQLRDDLG